MKADAQIQKDVMDQLKADPFLSRFSIGVAVKNGIVTLSGEVDSYAGKIAAERAARAVFGVKAIAEDLQIGVSPVNNRTDADIAASVVQALRWDVSVPDEKIRVKVEEGNVFLEGEVDWNYQRVAARRAIESIEGVRWVYNELVLRPKATPQDVKQRIDAAFHRSASIDADQISISVDGNVVTLRGRVRSFAEKEDAANAAWKVPGVTRVDDQLEISFEREGILDF
ncbi:BON domain-containing protein [Flaviaesturariibacter terrae]